jgi:hypothetical protein
LAALLIFTDVLVGSGGDRANAGSNNSRQKWTDFGEPPWTSGIEVGKTYEYSVNAHCGVHSARIDGTNWRADPVLDDGLGNPPKEWAAIGGVGLLRIVDKDTAVFSRRGRSVRFIRDQLPDQGPCA